MSEPKFTPGPWRAGKSIYQSQARVVAEKGGRVADVFAYEEDQAHANAALIAAAPEMYEMLKNICEGCANNRVMFAENVEGDCSACKISDLLKKARGEE